MAPNTINQEIEANTETPELGQLNPKTLYFEDTNTTSEQITNITMNQANTAKNDAKDESLVGVFIS